MAVTGAQKYVTCVTQKEHAKNCWCFVSLVFLNWKFNLQKTLCVGYYFNEVSIETVESMHYFILYVLGRDECVTRVTVTHVTHFCQCLSLQQVYKRMIINQKIYLDIYFAGLADLNHLDLNHRFKSRFKSSDFLNKNQ